MKKGQRDEQEEYGDLLNRLTEARTRVPTPYNSRLIERLTARINQIQQKVKHTLSI